MFHICCKSGLGRDVLRLMTEFNINSLLKRFSLNFEPTRWELKQHVSRSASSSSSPLFVSTVHVSRHSAECTTTNASQFWFFYFHSEFTWRLHSTQGQMYCTAWLTGDLHQTYSSWVIQLVIKLFRQKGNCKRKSRGVVLTSINILCSK